jgi:cell division septum initiation protein DivIVA
MPSNPFERVYDQIAELMALIYANAGKPIPQAKEMELNEKIKELKQQVKQLQAMSDKFTQGASVSDYMLQGMLTGADSKVITNEMREVLQRAEDLKAEVASAASDLPAAADAFFSSEKSKTDKRKSKEKSGKSRKLKFRGLGGVKDWKPL